MKTLKQMYGSMVTKITEAKADLNRKILKTAATVVSKIVIAKFEPQQQAEMVMEMDRIIARHSNTDPNAIIAIEIKRLILESKVS